MTDIPKELLDEALYPASEVVAAAHDYTRVVNIIARALMARDQRAAEIANGAMEDLWEDGCVRTFSAPPETIAKRILTYKNAG